MPTQIFLLLTPNMPGCTVIQNTLWQLSCERVKLLNWLVKKHYLQLTAPADQLAPFISSLTIHSTLEIPVREPSLEGIQLSKLQQTSWHMTQSNGVRLEQASLSPSGLLQIEISGPQSHFSFSRSGVEPKNLHCSRVLWGFRCCRVHMWRITDNKEIVMRQSQ